MPNHIDALMVPVRQNEVINRAVDAGGAKGTSIEEINDALIAASLPTVADMDEIDLIEDPMLADPIYAFCRYTIESIEYEILEPLFDEDDDRMVVDDVLAEHNMTFESLHNRAFALLMEYLDRPTMIDTLYGREVDRGFIQAVKSYIEERL